MFLTGYRSFLNIQSLVLSCDKEMQYIRHGDAIPRLSLPLGIAIAYLSSCDFIESGNSAGGSSLRQQTPDYVITYL